MSGNDMLLKFQQEIIAESKAHREYLDAISAKLYATLTIIGAVLVAVFSFLGWRGSRDIKRLATAYARKRLTALVAEQIGEFVATSTVQVNRTQKKLIKGIRTINEEAIRAIPDLVKHIAPQFPPATSRERKSILWVEDDEIGVNLYVLILQKCNLCVELASRTDDALRMCCRVPYDLVVTNMVRDDDPCVHPAGVTLVRELGKVHGYEDKRTIVFTRDCHKASLEAASDIAENIIACYSRDQLMEAIRRALYPDTGGGGQ